MVVMVFEIDQELCAEVAAILEPKGLTLSDAIVLLFETIAKTGMIPFTFTEEDLEEANNNKCVRFVLEYYEHTDDYCEKIRE